MAVVGGGGVDGFEEIELGDNVRRLKGEDFEDGFEDFGVVASAKGVDVDAQGLGVADGVGELDFATGSEAGGNDVFGNPAAHVGSGAVHFTGVFPGEGASSVTAGSAVSIDDDFTTSEAGVTLGATDDELAGGVNEKFGVSGDHLLGDDLFDDFIDAEFLDRLVIDISGVLGGDDDVDDAGGLAIDVFDRDLGFGIGAEPLGLASGFTNLGKLATELVREHDGGWHELGSLIASVTEHNALVASALFGGFFALGFFGVDALGDVGGLGGKEVGNEDFVGVENIVVMHVADSADGIADNFLYINDLADGLGADFWDGDLATDDDLIGLYEGLASDAGGLVDFKAGIENGIGNGVADFIGMALANGLGGENEGVAHEN